MFQRKLYKDLSANTIQTGVTQLSGIVIFYLMSRYISKGDFGAYSWSTAVVSTLLAITSLGLDLVLVKRIAAGNDVRVLAGIHFFHTIWVGLVILLSIFFIQSFWPNLFEYSHLFLSVIIQLVITNMANSIKYSLTGLEDFRSLAIVSSLVNGLKLILVVLLLVFKLLSVQNILYGFIVVAMVELCVNYYFIFRKIGQVLRPLVHPPIYTNIIKESLPQLGVVLFDSALARIDWIILGIVSGAAITAEYSFTYKFFELSKLPLLILAPVLLTRFSKIFNTDEELSKEKLVSIQQFFNLEMFVSMVIPMLMVFIWTDLIDTVTDGKYGAVNQASYTILAICVPIHFVINYLWTLAFVQGQLKEIMWITISSSLLNLIFNLIFIPFWQSEGAAISFLLSTMIQVLAYLKYIKRKRVKVTFIPLFQIVIVAFVIISLLKVLQINTYISALISLLLYFGFGYAKGFFSYAKTMNK